MKTKANFEANHFEQHLIIRMPNLPNDVDQLLQSCSAGDEPGKARVIERIVWDYSAYLYRLTVSILGSQDEAEDAVQETFIRAFSELSRYQPGTNFRAWLSKIALNICYGTLRKRKRRNMLEKALRFFQPLNSRSPEPEMVTLQKETRSQLLAALNALDEKHRLLLILHYLDGIPTAEVAEILGVPTGTVHSRLHYACLALRRQLIRSGDDWISERSRKKTV